MRRASRLPLPVDAPRSHVNTTHPHYTPVSLSSDFYLLHKDFGAYIAMMDKVDADYKDTGVWARKSILAAAAMGKFSSDRSIQEYAERIWKIKPLPVP